MAEAAQPLSASQLMNVEKQAMVQDVQCHQEKCKYEGFV